MAYTLEQFCKDTNAILDGDGDIHARLDKVAEKLGGLLTDETFVKATFSDDTPPGKRELYHDADARLLRPRPCAGRRQTRHAAQPWCVLGDLRQHQRRDRMREYKRTNGEAEEAAVLEKTDEYDLTRGVTQAYGPGHIHSTEHPEKCWVIRITGTDLDQIPRYRFRKFRDKVLEEA